MQEFLYVVIPAMIAGIAVAASHAPLGQEVLKRGIIFIDLAIAQIAALGVIIARMYLYTRCDGNHNSITGHSHYFIEYPISPEQVLAFIFALASAYFFMFIERKAKHVQEAIIGCSFVVATSVAMLLVANDPHGDGEIEAVLAGQILWASWKDIIAMLIASLIVLIFWFRASEERRKKLFYPLFAVCVTFSVQLVGVYLVFASLIFPALATYKLRNKKLFFAYIISIFSYLAGILVSYHLDLPASPTVIMAFVLSVLIIYFFTRSISEHIT